MQAKRIAIGFAGIIAGFVLVLQLVKRAKTSPKVVAEAFATAACALMADYGLGVAILAMIATAAWFGAKAMRDKSTKEAGLELELEQKQALADRKAARRVERKRVSDLKREAMHARVQIQTKRIGASIR